MTSQFLLKGHKTLNFLFAFSLEISEPLKLISLERKQISTNGKKNAFFSVFNGLSYQHIKELSKLSMQKHFNQCTYAVDMHVELDMYVPTAFTPRQRVHPML